MTSFRDHLIKKLNASLPVERFESPAFSPMVLHLIRELKPMVQRQHSLPMQAILYQDLKRQLDVRRAKAREEKVKELKSRRRSEWADCGLLRPYEHFVQEGVWDFSPGDTKKLKSIYRRILLKVHPDHNKTDTNERTRKIVSAFQEISIRLQSDQQGDGR